MYQSPRMRRLRNDLAALERLRSESSVFRFSTQGDPPQHYRIQFVGRGLWRDHGKVRVLERHHVEIKLGSSYPRTIPEIRWLTPVYHPNISEIGMVCLGGYGTHWVPSVQLDELCTMLWDMVRYHNYDIRSPYNRDAALWVAQQQTFRFPTDDRPLRDLRAALGRVPAGASEERPPGANGRDGSGRSGADSSTGGALGRVRRFAAQQYARIQYGRVFVAGAEVTESRRPEPAEPPAPAMPANSELSDLVAAQAGAPAAAPADEPVFILEPESPEDRTDVAEFRRQAPDRPAAGTPPFSRPSADDVRRLLTAHAPADEILFIE
jgi:ubiquitin-protein ligase